MPQLDFNLFYANITIVEITYGIIYLLFFLLIVPKTVFNLKFKEKWKEKTRENLLNKKGENEIMEIFYFEGIKEITKKIFFVRVMESVKTKIKIKIEEERNQFFFYVNKKNDLNQLKTECQK